MNRWICAQKRVEVQPDADGLEAEPELLSALTMLELALVDAGVQLCEPESPSEILAQGDEWGQTFEVGPFEPAPPSEILAQGDAAEQTFEGSSGSWGRRDLDRREGLRERD